jgi:hypothetical protein
VKLLRIAAALACLALAVPAHARMSLFVTPELAPADISPARAPEVHVSYGQSWRSNSFDSFASPFGFSPQHETLLAGHVPSIGTPTFLPGPLAVSAGINLSQSLDGITGYGPTDVFSIGRTAILAQQLLRVRHGGFAPLVPIIEADFAFPASTWGSGGGGGLAPGAHFTGSVASDVLTVTAVTAGETMAVNQNIATAPGLDSRTVITSLGTGTGGTGTYNVTIGQVFVTSTVAMTHATVTGFVTNESAGSGNVFNVSAVLSGTVTVGDAVGSPAAAGTTIISQRDGAAGGIGNYIVRVGAAQSVGAEAMFAQGTSWKNMLTVLGQFQTVLPAGKLLAANFKSMGYTQGGSLDGTPAGKIADLTDMLTKYDALNLPGQGTTGARYYLGLPSAISTAVIANDSEEATTTFLRTNAPGAGGTWSGRAYATSPSYAWQFNGLDNIHTGDYGTARWGEWEGYVRYQVQDLGVSWTPLWRPLTGGAITVSGQDITIPFARPTSTDFAVTPMVMQSDAQDGIKVWPSNGFNVRRSGAFLTVNNVAISGMYVVVTVGQPLSPGDVLEVSYAWYGPGGTNPGPSSGVGGNLVMPGPASVLFPGKTIDAWAWPFLESITI